MIKTYVQGNVLVTQFFLDLHMIKNHNQSIIAYNCQVLCAQMKHLYAILLHLTAYIFLKR